MALFIVAVAVLAFILGMAFGGRRARARQRLERDAVEADVDGDGAAPVDPEPAPAVGADAEAADAGDAAPAEAPPSDLAALIARLEAPYDASGHPGELVALPDFQAAVAILADPATPLDRAVEAAVGGNSALAMVGAEALAARRDAAQATDRLLDHLRFARVWTLFGILRFLACRADRPVLWDVLLQASEWWSENPVLPGFVSTFVDARIARGDPTAATAAIARHPGFRMQDVRALVARLTSAAAPELGAALDAWERTRVDVAALRQIGRIGVGDRADADPVIDHAALHRAVVAVLEDLEAPTPKSVVLVGEAGVGKTAIARRVGALLAERGWTVFEASAADVMAGQSYLGELEKRTRELLDQIDVARRVVWFVPGFHELALAGRHRYSQTSVLDLVLPAIEAGRIVILGEAAPTAMERVVQHRPRLRFALTLQNVEPLGIEETLALARRVVTDEIIAAGLAASADVAADALDLARSYLDGSALPGAVIGLLRQTRQRVVAAGGNAVTRDDVIATVGAITGLPRTVLDERAGLDPRALRDLFSRRVMGQPEAVASLVDRVAMLKAGLVDTRRPIGVFLFAGPTGTGKTEVAKTLATFLFGSPDRLLRLDMSEFQDAGSMARLVGEAGDESTVESLVQRIRKQPFAVVLLDEFEKSHPRVWDLFLQIFDDGRLTDANGQVADFRHAIIILTSNAGATVHQSGSLGFTGAGGAFSEAQVTRALAGLFRPEFLNRIDRVVVFRPLAKAVMRDILRKELGDVLQRRGFRNRDWAVEWEPSAIEFLLERGFTPDMGARPLRRAIEEHLLAPLAMTIVDHRFPEGDQFLFVKSDGQGIQVEFIDPDAPAPAAAGSGGEPVAAAADSGGEPAGAGTPPDLGRLILAPRGDVAERRLLAARAQAITDRVADAEWTTDKDRLLAQVNADGFWSRDDRFVTLDRIERMDRVSVEVDALQSLVRRLDAGRTPAPAVVSGVAQRLLLIEAAFDDLRDGVPGDAWVVIDAVAMEGAGKDERAAGVADWPGRVARMYREWGRRRGMRVTAPGTGSGGMADGAPVVLALAGLGARRLLARETGLHVFETPDGAGGFHRTAARVRVVAQPVTPLPRDRAEREEAIRLGAAGEPVTTVVRRYREAPSPLVRDAVEGWRTGRLDDVLGGDFDLFGAAR